MHSNDEYKRLFFAFEIEAPWPIKLPEGRLLEEACRHLTLAFLGNIHYPTLQRILPSFPPPNFKMGMVGKFNKCRFLPKKHPNVVAWSIEWFQKDEYHLEAYQKEVVEWLQSHDFSVNINKKGFLPHVTLCRSPFQYKEWRKAFTPLPMMCKGLHLYESIGNLKYKPIWSYALHSPIEEIDHTADFAFLIRGENLSQIHKHAAVALTFLFPPLLSFISDKRKIEDLEDIIIDLNRMITKADLKQGCPLKAVSFHGELLKQEDQIYAWEMIIDV